MTGRQLYVISISAAAQMFDFLDFFLISFVIAVVAKPWHLTFGATTVILLSSGVGAVIGSFLCGALADRVGGGLSFWRRSSSSASARQRSHYAAIVRLPQSALSAVLV
jgi:MFS transporter, putative metabolite:H+ symporter